MGTSPSKEENRNTKTGNLSKESSSSTVDSSLESEGQSMRGGKKEAGEMMAEATMTSAPEDQPKTKGHNGFEAQSRVDRQLARSTKRDDEARPKPISDDQVHVNLAMADLMAYLQVVANNSNNLPLTRRDDPELTRMVSNLSSEEYARKSAAFVPADVRVIAGSFTKYGRVWDLPTSEEYNAEDGAQEPGRSYGGACSNAMLKVLYDAANDVDDAAQTMEAANALFDDDEDEENASLSSGAFRRNHTFASIDMNDHCNPSTISWVDLLRKMKAEIKDIEYPQVPTITSTRKFDLNQPFSLVPESFDHKKGKKRSLLIGCNYGGIEGAQLKASHDDVRSMKDYIVNVHGFPEHDELMTVLLDDEEHKHPTFLNITDAFKALSEQSQPGDAVFIQFSGHGGRVLDSHVETEAESYDEVIAPTDYEKSGLVRDTLMFKTLLAPMRYGVTVTIIIDSCDTGMVLDLPYAWTTRSDRSSSVVKMAQNDDFSFVRFLKVVKTLYESSTFTQLGNVVGSVLSLQPNSPREVSAGDEDDTYQFTVTSSTAEDDEENTLQNTEMQLMPRPSFMNNILGVCGPQQEDAEEQEVVDSVVVKQKSMSFMEQVMSCTFGHEVEDVSEDEKSFCSYDEETLGDSTFDSTIDDGYESRQRGRSSRNRRRKKH